MHIDHVKISFKIKYSNQYLRNEVGLKICDTDTNADQGPYSESVPVKSQTPVKTSNAYFHLIPSATSTKPGTLMKNKVFHKHAKPH